MAKIRNDQKVAAPEAPAAEAAGLAPAREVDLQGALRTGVFGGVAIAFVAATGMLVAFNTPRLLTLGTISFGHALLVLIPLLTGYLAGRPPPVLEGYAESRIGPRNVLAGLIAGVAAGVVAALFAVFTGNIDLRSVLVNISPVMTDTLTFARGLPLGTSLLAVGGVAAGTVGGALNLLPDRWRLPLFGAVVWVMVFGLLSAVIRQIIRGTADLIRLTGFEAVGTFLYSPGGGLSPAGTVLIAAAAFAGYRYLGSEGRVRKSFAALPDDSRRRWKLIGLGVAVLIVAVLPWLVGSFLSRVLVFAGVFLLMAFGLNIVVGFAGLLDLGYVAFFAVGAYTTAVLMSPISPAITPELSFFAAIPFIMMAAALAGLMVGTPVLRMRGDYLAIVTLGFGEIARLLFLSDALTGTFGGAQGLRNIPDISIFGFEFGGSQWFFYPVLFFVLIAAYVSWSLQESRMGRAWMAMREDQSVAEAMGVNYVSAKLWAFVIGAMLGAFGGALFAINLNSVFPHFFDIVVSITVLVIIIVGGLGSLPGVVVGALALIMAPQLLREFEEFRFLMYGTLLILMMLKRPEGLVPSRRRAEELHEAEAQQDAWLKKQQEAEHAQESREESS